MVNAVIEVLTRDLGTGHFHKRFREEGQTELASYEACNVDEAGAFEIVAEDFGDVPVGVWTCRRCFPESSPPDEDG